jgi:hypothetical protein
MCRTYITNTEAQEPSNDLAYYRAAMFETGHSSGTNRLVVRIRLIYYDQYYPWQFYQYSWIRMCKCAKAGKEHVKGNA